MIFRLSLNSAFTSAAVAAAALVATATSDSDVSMTDSPPTADSNLRSKINDSYVPFKIADSKGVGFDGAGFDDVGKDGIEQSLRLENSSKKITRTRQLRNRKSSAMPTDNSSPTMPFDHSADIGALDRGRVPSDTNANPDDTNNDRELTNSDSDLQDYCYDMCGSNRRAIPFETNIKALLKPSVDCSGDEDDIDYRCPSQVKCWDTSRIKNMNYALYYSTFNEPLTCWDVSSVTSMSAMFRSNRADGFKGIGNWDVSSVENMDSMFKSAKGFNQNLESWNVSSVTSMEKMFWNAQSFNQNLESWNVSSVTSMAEMFYYAHSFNQAVEEWDVSSVSDMYKMFYYAKSFNQCLSSWADKTSLTNQSNNSTLMLKYSGCTVTTDVDPMNGPWCQDSNDQCLEVSCVDDPYFLFEGKDSQDCEWAGLGDPTENRCANEGVFEACSETCDPVCGTVCTDDPGFQLNGIEHKTCEWVAKQETAERCMKPGVMTSCRQTCKPPNPLCLAVIDCTDDSNFLLNGVSGKTCEWVKKKKTEERCKKTGVMAACRQTCNPVCACNDSTDEFDFHGSTITCDDLDTVDCDEEPTRSDGFTEFQLIQMQSLFDSLIDKKLDEALEPIHQKLDALDEDDGSSQRRRKLGVEDMETFKELCPRKCNNCPGT